MKIVITWFGRQAHLECVLDRVHGFNCWFDFVKISKGEIAGVLITSMFHNLLEQVIEQQSCCCQNFWVGMFDMYRLRFF